MYGQRALRPSLFATLAMVALTTSVVACASSSDRGDGASTDDALTGSGGLLDGQNLTADQLAALAPVGDGSSQAAILFPSSGDPQVRGKIVGGGKVTVVYALNRLSVCRATHDGFGIWDTRIGGEFSNGALIGEELGPDGAGGVQGSLRTFFGPGGTSGTARIVPLTFTVPAHAENFFLYAHNTSPPGPAEACDTFDSKNSANFHFEVNAPTSALVLDGSNPGTDALSSLVDIGDGKTSAAILFPTNGDPVVKGNLVAGGHVTVAYSLDRLKQCRASHDGFPFWVTQIGGQFSDGTKFGDELNNGSFFNSAESQPGHVVTFVPNPGQEEPFEAATATTFSIPKNVTEVQLYAHNWNPGGPVEACSAFDSKSSANYHFPVRAQ